MHNSPLVSVIINCFNGEQFISKCIQSVLDQTYHNFEVIIWDNKSTDNSIDIVKEIIDKRFKIYENNIHTNISTARNNALNYAKGEFICFLDVDDYWDKNKLIRQLKAFEKQTVGLSFTNFWYLKTIKGKIYKKNIELKFEKNLISKIIKKYEIVLSTLMFKSNLLNKLNKPFNEEYHIISDFDFTLRLANITEFSHIKEALTYRTWHGKNETILKRREAVQEIENWIEINESNYKKKYKEEINFLKNKSIYDKINFNLKDRKYNDAIRLFAKNSLSSKYYYLRNILMRVFLK